MSDSKVDTVLSKKDTRRLVSICEGRMLPESINELCCYNAYVMRVQGFSMDECLSEMDPPIADLDIHELRHFLVGIAFAEQFIVEFKGSLDIEDDEEKTYN